MTEEVLIVGTGALASLFAARVSTAGINVTMLGTWQEGLAALQSHGVRVRGESGESLVPVTAASAPDGLGPFQRALVLVKAWQTPRAAEQLKRVLAPEGLALTLQNGLGNLEILSSALGKERAALGTTTTGATLLGPGVVRPGGEGVITLGAHPRIEPTRRMLRKAGFAVEMSADIQAVLWGKLAVNAAINPLTALLGVPNGKLLESPSSRQLMALAVLEVARVAAALGITLPVEDPVGLAESVARKTAANHSSMLQDIRRGAPTEIDAICGAVVRAGEKTGLPTPVNQTLLLCIQSAAALHKDAL